MISLKTCGRRLLICLVAPVIVGGLLYCGAARADDFFRGKTLTIVLFSGPGGPYDTYARLLAPSLGRHVPGSPTVIVQNMPGAGGLVAAHYLSASAPKDGTVIGEVSQSLVLEPLLGSNAGNVNWRQFEWLGSMSQSTALYVSWKNSNVKTASDLLEKPLLIAGTGAASETTITSNALNGIVGTKIKLVQGYSGSPAAMHAMEQGETDGAFPTLEALKTTHPDWLTDHKINLLFQARRTPDPEMAQVPTVMTLARNETQRKALEFLFPRDTLGRPFVAPPGVPPERFALLRRAFADALKDPALLADARRMHIPIEPSTGEDLAKVVAEEYATNKDTIDLVRSFIPQD